MKRRMTALLLSVVLCLGLLGVTAYAEDSPYVDGGNIVVPGAGTGQSAGDTVYVEVTDQNGDTNLIQGTVDAGGNVVVDASGNGLNAGDVSAVNGAALGSKPVTPPEDPKDPDQPEQPGGNNPILPGWNLPDTPNTGSKPSDKTGEDKKDEDKTDEENPGEQPGETAPGETESSEPAKPMSFVDVSAGDWFYSAVQYVFENGIMTGDGSAATFNPSGNMTRAMVWTVLGRLSGADVSGSGANWYSRAQAWAVAQEISDGTNPNGGITREELVTMLWRYAGSPAASADLSAFTDSGSVSSWAESAIQWAVSNGILTGDNGRLNPGGRATRAEVASILMRYCRIIPG